MFLRVYCRLFLPGLKGTIPPDGFQWPLYMCLVSDVKDAAAFFFLTGILQAPDGQSASRKSRQITISVKPHRLFSNNDLEITAPCKFFFVGFRNVNFT